MVIRLFTMTDVVVSCRALSSLVAPSLTLVFSRDVAISTSLLDFCCRLVHCIIVSIFICIILIDGVGGVLGRDMGFQFGLDIIAAI